MHRNALRPSEPASAKPLSDAIHRIRLCSVAVLFCFAAPLDAQQEMARVHELTITPAAAPVPALMYELLPPLREIKHGNAKQAYVEQGMKLYELSERHPEFDEQLRRWLEIDATDLSVDHVQPFLETTYAPILSQIETAARLSRCDWEMDFRKGLDTKLPPIGSLRHAATALRLRTRLARLTRRYEDAVRDLQTGLAMARAIGNGPTLVHTLSGSAIASGMVQEIQRMAGDVDSPNLYWAIVSLPRPFIDLRNGMRGEERWLGSFFDGLEEVTAGQFSTNLAPDELKKRNQEVIDAVNDWSGVERQDGGVGVAFLPLMRLGVARDALMKQGFKKEQLDRIPPAEIAVWYDYQQYRARRDELAKAFGLPYWLAHNIHRRAEEEFKRNPPPKEDFISSFIPALGWAHFIVTRDQRRIVAAAIIQSIRHHLATHDGQPPASLDELELPALDDPVTGEPFGYEVDGRTITLIGHVLEGMDPAQGDRWVLTIAEPGDQSRSRPEPTD